MCVCDVCVVLCVVWVMCVWVLVSESQWPLNSCPMAHGDPVWDNKQCKQIYVRISQPFHCYQPLFAVFSEDIIKGKSVFGVGFRIPHSLDDGYRIIQGCAVCHNTSGTNWVLIFQRHSKFRRCNPSLTIYPTAPLSFLPETYSFNLAPVFNSQAHLLTCWWYWQWVCHLHNQSLESASPYSRASQSSPQVSPDRWHFAGAGREHRDRRSGGPEEQVETCCLTDHPFLGEPPISGG